MFAVSDAFKLAHLVLLLGLIGAASLLLLVTVTNRLRLRRVLLSWRTGRLFGFPLWPSLFLAGMAGLTGYALGSGQLLDASLLAGYLAGGVCWFVAAWLTSSIVVTEYGFLRNVNCADQSVAWGQVVDYFEFATERRRGFVFFYMNGHGERCRLELPVPAGHYDAFREAVSRKLDARFEFAAQQAYGKKALEG